MISAPTNVSQASLDRDPNFYLEPPEQQDPAPVIYMEAPEEKNHYASTHFELAKWLSSIHPKLVDFAPVMKARTPLSYMFAYFFPFFPIAPTQAVPCYYFRRKISMTH